MVCNPYYFPATRPFIFKLLIEYRGFNLLEQVAIKSVGDIKVERLSKLICKLKISGILVPLAFQTPTPTVPWDGGTPKSTNSMI